MRCGLWIYFFYSADAAASSCHVRFVSFRVEIGIFTDANANMWCDYFPYADVVVGLDTSVGNVTAKSHDRVKHVVAGGGLRRNLNKFAAHPIAGSFDIIVDASNSRWMSQQETFAVLFHLLRPGGYYIVEDEGDIVEAETADTFLHMAQRYLKSNVIASAHMSEAERQFLEREIGALQLVYMNDAKSRRVMVVRRAMSITRVESVSMSSSPSSLLTSNLMHARHNVNGALNTLSVEYTSGPSYDNCLNRKVQWMRTWNPTVRLVL